MALSSCTGIHDDATSPPKLASVTYLVTPNGLGDNSYNDAASEGIFGFSAETGIPLSMLVPDGIDEAEVMMNEWLTANASRDSAVLIVGSSVYEDIARHMADTRRDDLNTLRSHGGRVMLFETDAVIDGITTVIIARYGVSWLAGAMSRRFDALVLAATDGVALLEESIAGFMEAREDAGSDADGRACRTTLHYLSADASGFAMPDSAYRYIAARADNWFFYDEFIFPLLGGSEAGVVRYLNSDEFQMALMAGMDVDQTGLSTRIPFSVVFKVGEVLNRLLHDWAEGTDWPAHLRLHLKDGAADIVITPHFSEFLSIIDDRYGDPDTFQLLYDQYKEQAISKEEAYENH